MPQRNVSLQYNWCPSKVHFRANVKRCGITLARKWTFDGHKLYCRKLPYVGKEDVSQWHLTRNEPYKVSEHTNNQIKESIRASATCGELEIVIDRELTTFTESIEIIRKRRDDLVEDYERLSPKRSDLSRSVALKRENLSKNRYTDVLPYDDTRKRFSLVNNCNTAKCHSETSS